MKKGQRVTSLLAMSLLLPLGIWTAADGQAFTSPTITVTSPAAGTTLNIANNEVTVEVTFLMIGTATKNIRAYIGLANTTAAGTALSTLNAADTGRILDDNSDAGEEAQLEADLGSAMPTHALGAGTEGRVLGKVDFNSFVTSGSIGNITNASISGGTAGDGFVSKITATIVVGSDAGEAANIVAFALLENNTDNTTSGLISSGAADAFNGDWNAPGYAGNVSATLVGAGGEDPAIVTGGTAASLAPVKPGDILTATVNSAPLSGRTAQIRIKLDPAQGSDIVVPLAISSDTDGTAAYTFTASDFADADGDGPDVADEARIIAALELIDAAGNTSGSETGIGANTVVGNTDAAIFSGSASSATQTAFDNNAPVLAFAASPGVLPASNGIISDGGLNAFNAAIPSDGYGTDTVDNAGLLQYENEEAWESLKINFSDSESGVNADVKIINAGNSLASAELGAAAADQVRIIDISDATLITVTSDFDNNGHRTAIGNTDAAIFGGGVNDPSRGFAPDRRDPSTGWADEAYTATREHIARSGASEEVSVHWAQDSWNRVMAASPEHREAEYRAALAGHGAPLPVHGDAVPSGSYTVTYQAVDLAGNASNALVATNVWVDNENPSFNTYAPAAVDNVVNDETVDPEYSLSEDVSVLELTISAVTTDGVALKDSLAPHVINASGSLLTAGAAHVLPVTATLVDDQVYSFNYRLRDIAGNWTTYSDEVNRTYDAEFIVPVINHFAIIPGDNENLAGDENGAMIKALAVDGRNASTYEGSATLTVNCNDDDVEGIDEYEFGRLAFPDCDGVSISGAGVTDNGDGTWSLDDGWDSLASREIAIENETATIGFTITVTDASTAGGPYTGTSPEIVYFPEEYSGLWLWADDATAGSAFDVHVAAVDEFRNIRWMDERLINLSANRPAEVPGAVLLEDGIGSVLVNASAGDLDILATDPIALNYDTVLASRLSIVVDGVSAPDQVVAYDWPDDQGGFLVVSSTGLDAGNTYQISREVTVFDEINDEGELVVLDDGYSDYISWATFVANGDDPQRVVVATLDNNESFWAVRGVETAVAAKQAFDGEVAVSSPYELMTRTMVESKKLAQLDPSIPVFAELTPEAFSYIDGSFAPNFKSGGVVQSSMTITEERVRAIDNIAPEPVSGITAFDTPDDRGSSITVNWVKSESDGMLARTASAAVGPENADTVMGVKGYNVYRSVNGGEQSMVGKVAPGVTSFVDNTALNGLRYHYGVAPYDDDNLATSELFGSAFSVRNIAFDSKGVAIQGLFGADRQVGFDDFFIFADHFGQVGGSNSFDPAFDLNPDNQINFFDFFVFADNFGKVAVGASKAVPLAAGLNDNARIDLAATEALPRVGEEMVVNLSLADFAQLKGYGFTVSFDPMTFEFVRVEALDERFGAEEIAKPQVVADADGEVSIVAYGESLADGELMLDLVIRPIMETENGLIEISRGELADESLALNQIASLGAIAVETRPEEFALRNNYPNPFNPSTTIKYQLPDAADVRLEIYNVVGQSVRTLVDQQEAAGRYELQWDATNNNGQSLSSGIYFYRIQAGAFQEVKKMLLMK